MKSIMKVRDPRYNQLRPVYFVGQAFLESENNILTVEGIRKVFDRHGIIDYKGSVSKMIFQLTNHPYLGGSVIVAIRQGRNVVAYKLMTPERLNKYGQNVVYALQYDAMLKAHGRPLKSACTHGKLVLGEYEADDRFDRSQALLEYDNSADESLYEYEPEDDDEKDEKEEMLLLTDQSAA